MTEFYTLGEDKQALIEDAKKAGFRNAVAFYSPNYLNFKDGEEASIRLTEYECYNSLSEEKKKEVKKKFLSLHEAH